MFPIQAVLATQHIEDLRRAAAAERRAHPVDVDIHLTPRGPFGSRDPRKALARVASGISRAAAATARRLDPPVEQPTIRSRAALPGC